MVLYLYALAFGVFMTETFRLPAPIIFSIPLIILFKEKKNIFLYKKELWVFTIAIFCYYILGLENFKTFAANMIGVIMCMLYFNYFVGSNTTRFNFSVLIFFMLLGISAVVGVINNFYPETKSLREFILDEPVLQSPAGLSTTQFTFGYQLAAFAPFALIYTFLYSRPFYIKLLAFAACLVFIYFGMQRSVFIAFLGSVAIFMVIFYRLKAVIFIGIGILVGTLLFNYVLKNYSENDNIITKNINNDPEFDRTLLTAENLKILADHPLGLVFYGKSWADVIYRNRVFVSGVTSHNAYLMFLTYLGPFLGLLLLIIIYTSIFRIGFNALKEIRHKENALLVCLCFAFLSISINALSHNASLLSADGPTVFLYFSILHLGILRSERTMNQVF